ncbi:MAG: helix-turn-helix domain-containing protein [Devosia sp.]|nr:helix-turn-helix domain-containing protein [Devosia sp.]
MGDHVRERRRSRGLTQTEAAAEIGVCRDALARWELRPIVPDVHVMPAVIAFLGYNPLPPARSFPELLLRARRTRGLSQPAFAEVVAVPADTLRNWEQGLYLPGTARRAWVEARIAALMEERP